VSTETVAVGMKGWRGMPTLGKVAVAALLGMAAVVLVGTLLIGGELDAFSLIFVGIGLVPGLLGASGWRWAMAVVAVLSTLLLVALSLFLGPELARPHEPAFGIIVPVLALMLVGAVAAWGATVQNYLGGERRAPRWVSYALVGLGGLVMGAVAVGLIPQQGAVAGVTQEVMAGLPEVRTHEFAFSQGTVRVRAGETVLLRLVNEDGSAHSFDIDALDVHAYMPSKEQSLAMFQPGEPGAYVFYCGIPGHADPEAGTGMVGTLIVEPAAG
jgi:uncharacterized cupredoxin-like copper-binding protein